MTALLRASCSLSHPSASHLLPYPQEAYSSLEERELFIAMRLRGISTHEIFQERVVMQQEAYLRARQLLVSNLKDKLKTADNAMKALSSDLAAIDILAASRLQRAALEKAIESLQQEQKPLQDKVISAEKELTAMQENSVSLTKLLDVSKSSLDKTAADSLLTHLDPLYDIAGNLNIALARM